MEEKVKINTTCCCENFKNTTLCCGNFKCVVYEISEKEEADSLRISVASNVKMQTQNYVKMCCQEGFIVDYNRKICVENRDPILK